MIFQDVRKLPSTARFQVLVFPPWSILWMAYRAWGSKTTDLAPNLLGGGESFLPSNGHSSIDYLWWLVDKLMNRFLMVNASWSILDDPWFIQYQRTTVKTISKYDKSEKCWGCLAMSKLHPNPLELGGLQLQPMPPALGKEFAITLYGCQKTGPVNPMENNRKTSGELSFDTTGLGFTYFKRFPKVWTLPEASEQYILSIWL